MKQLLIKIFTVFLFFVFTFSSWSQQGVLPEDITLNALELIHDDLNRKIFLNGDVKIIFDVMGIVITLLDGRLFKEMQ